MTNIKNKINSSRCIPRLDFKFQINQLNLIEVVIFSPKYSTLYNARYWCMLLQFTQTPSYPVYHVHDGVNRENTLTWLERQTGRVPAKRSWHKQSTSHFRQRKRYSLFTVPRFQLLVCLRYNSWPRSERCYRSPFPSLCFALVESVQDIPVHFVTGVRMSNLSFLSNL